MSFDVESSEMEDEAPESPDQEPLSLVAGRERRSTAGNRLNTLLEREGDDELELLFAEDEAEEDVEFREDDEDPASDVQLDSSSDDDDQGPTAGADDLEGEKELEKQERAEKKKKRKAQELYKRPGLLPKRVRVDPTTTSVQYTTPTARLKKKSERLSWLPTSDEGPVRSSSRMQTIQNKEVVHQRMQQHEQRRKRQIKVMEAAAAKKEASKPQALTQADRMVEAARVEKKNARSLNRWEEAEKRRLEEQKARLEALHNRKLIGPVISWWSGPAKWINGKLASVGTLQMIEDIKDTSKRRVKQTKDSTDDRSVNAAAPLATNSVTSAQMAISLPLSRPRPQEDVVEDHAAAPASTSSPASNLIPGAAANPFLVVPPPVDDEAKASSDLREDSPQSSFVLLPQSPSILTAASSVVPEPPPPADIEVATRNLVTLIDLDSAAMRMPEMQNHVLLRKKVKLSKPSPQICAITLHPARYCDPTTKLPYANAYAFKEIQKLSLGSCVWNDLMGCFVGAVDGAAQGVPSEFRMMSSA